jgi:uncharacterized protein
VRGATVTRSTPVRRGPRTLSRAEIETILGRNWWGVLATTLNGEPYGVPVAYGYDGDALYIATGPGRKLANLMANPLACFTITEVGAGDAGWCSVIVAGEATPIESLAERLRALNVLRRQVAGHRTASPRDAATAARASVIRLVPEERTGRASDG